jgi:hypothetical protein
MEMDKMLQATAIAHIPCCQKNCLLSKFHLDIAANIVRSCMKEVENMNWIEKKDYLRYYLFIIYHTVSFYDLYYYYFLIIFIY